MIRLDFPWSTSNGRIIHTIIQEHRNGPYFIYVQDILIGSIQKVDGNWAQTSGDEILDDIIENMGMFIQEQANIAKLPDEIKALWPTEVVAVEVISDAAYLIIIGDEIDITKFEIEFRDQITDWVDQQWQVKFQVTKRISEESFEVDVN
ncbi:hypothetical protein [Chryseobacterium sp. G0201]|uniref:hypothetical protein n=1 Tax=Chryseobacterium sp. G0201 TaxID=2487065 RepID=UPI000F6EE0D6|nr:hypothetical protein [Chryseobacterium sp. G0201]AZA54573.1 hypothetical protein EG348_17020 [Chryseobacterium sp. G0201]